MKSLLSVSALVTLLCVAAPADAHVSISSGPATAGRSQKITFSVGHGCEGADTVALRVEIPAGVTSVRGLSGPFGKPAIEGPAAAVTAVSWRKPNSEVLAEDVGYYELSLRARVDDVPFTRLHFRVVQTCRTAAGVESTVAWEGEDAAELLVVPARQPGWNRYSLASGASIAAADLPAFFGDALIVWRGTAAYSANAATMALIAGTAGVTPLASDLAAGDELWVRY
jgi:uncharacterized protein YcnI